MPSAGKSLVQLVTSTEAHVAWVDVDTTFRLKETTGPVILLWGTRMFVLRTISRAGFFLFMEAGVIVSRTPSPGLPAPLDTGRA